MKIIAAVLLLLAAPLAAQTIAPSQIKPGTNGQSLQTVAGKAAWANNSTSVSSVFGRTGAIVPVTGDYNCSQITSAICSLPSLFNQTVEVDGTPKTQRAKLNFINGSAGTVTCVDNPVSLATDCTFTGGAASGITYSIADVSGSKTFNVTYQNTSSSPLFIGGSAQTNLGSRTARTTVSQGPTAFSLPFTNWDAMFGATVNAAGGGNAGFSAIIMPGYYYRVSASGDITGARQWVEISSTGGGGGGGGFTAAGDLSGSSSSQTVVGLDSVPFCGGFAPTNGQFIELTTGSSPNPCYTATTPSGSGNTTSTSLTTNRLPKANGANSIIDSSVSDNGTTVSTTEPLTAPAVNAVINAGSSLSAAVTACGSAQTTIQITQTIAVGTGITVPANCTLLFQSAGTLTGTAITINQNPQASRHQIFGAGLAVTFGPLITEAPIEWFGGKADATGSVGVGTDNLAPFNAANTALSAGCITFVAGGYRFSGTPTFTKTNMCIAGITIGYPGTAIGIPANSSNLFIDSASANGPRFTSTALYGEIRNVAVLRTQTPTGTAKGISVEAQGVKVHDLASQDSIYNVYYVGAGSAALGITENVITGWGYTGLAGTPGVPVCGFYVDSAGGAVNASIRFLYASAGSNLGGGTTTGLCAFGTNISDLSVNHFESAHLNFGIDLENTGTTNFVAQDIQINDSILNGCITVCLKINGAQSTTDNAPHVSIQGGNYAPEVVNAIGALIENSTNVSIVGVQIVAGDITQTDISLSSVNGFIASNNILDDAASVSISCLNSTHGQINGNQIKNGGTFAVGIKNVGCTQVAEQGNTIAGNGANNIGTPMSFDSGSSNNGPWSLNNIDASQAFNPVSDAGTNNNTMAPSVLIAGTVTDSALTAGQQVVAGASGLLSNGGTAILSCANTSASGTAQSCTTSPSFAPAANSCILYTTTTANSGAGLTLNVNSLGAKSVAKWLGTTTLAAGDVPANSPQMACYNGTVWNLSTIGNAPSGGGGSITFPQTVAGTVNSGGLVYANSGTQISVSPAGTAGQVVLWGGAGTAPGAQAIGTSGATIPLLNTAVTFSGAAGASAPSLNLTGSLFTGGSGTTTFPFAYINNGASGPTNFSTSGTEFGINAPSGFAGNFLDFRINGAASAFTVAANGATTGRSFSANGGFAQLTSSGFAEGSALASIGTKFTTSGCSVSSTTGGGSAGIFTLGANACTVVLTMNGGTGITAPNGWSCQAHDRTAPTVLIGGESSSTTTTASLTIPAGAGTTDVISFACIAF